jgi:hypothetical protein
LRGEKVSVRKRKGKQSGEAKRRSKAEKQSGEAKRRNGVSSFVVLSFMLCNHCVITRTMLLIASIL